MTNSPNEYTAQQAQNDAKLAQAKNSKNTQTLLEFVFGEIRKAAQNGDQYCLIQLEENESSKLLRASQQTKTTQSNDGIEDPGTFTPSTFAFNPSIFVFNVAIAGHQIIAHSAIMNKVCLTNAGQYLIDALRKGGYKCSLIDFPNSKLKITWLSNDYEEKTLMIEFESEEDRTPTWPPKR